LNAATVAPWIEDVSKDEGDVIICHRIESYRFIDASALGVSGVLEGVVRSVPFHIVRSCLSSAAHSRLRGTFRNGAHRSDKRSKNGRQEREQRHRNAGPEPWSRCVWM